MNTEYTAHDIANWFINRAKEDVEVNGGEYITHLKLQKLLYFAQGCYSVLEGKPLFPEKIYNWTHGPVVADVYRDYKKYGDLGIETCEEVNVDRHTDAVLEEVYRVFGKYSAWGLREITHQQDPWKNTSLNEEIPLDSIEKYFRNNIVTD